MLRERVPATMGEHNRGKDELLSVHVIRQNWMIGDTLRCRRQHLGRTGYPPSMQGNQTQESPPGIDLDFDQRWSASLLPALMKIRGALTNLDVTGRGRLNGWLGAKILHP